MIKIQYGNMTVHCETVKEAWALMGAMRGGNVTISNSANTVTVGKPKKVKVTKSRAKTNTFKAWNINEVAFVVKSIKNNKHFKREITKDPILSSHPAPARSFQYYCIKRYLDGKGTQYMAESVKQLVDQVVAPKRSILDTSRTSPTFGSNNQ